MTELENRIHTQMEKIPHRRVQARFIRAAMVLVREKEIHGVVNLARRAGYSGTRTGAYMAGKILLKHLREAQVIETPEREMAFVQDLGHTLEDHRYVIRLHQDLTEAQALAQESDQ